MEQPAGTGGGAAGIPDPEVRHFVNYLGLEIWHEEGVARASMRVTRQMWSGERKRPMAGVIFTMADMVAGSPPGGPIGPTIELRLRMLSSPPSEGRVLADARPLKAGKRLFSGEVTIREESSLEPFALAEFTFLNQVVAEASGDTYAPRGARHDAPALPVATFADLFAMRYRGPGAVEMDPHEGVRNGPQGTIQGGAQASLAEVAAEWLLEGRSGGGGFEVVDLHVRYLNPVTAGPALAEARLLSDDDERPVVKVAISDAGASGRLVSSALVVCRRVV